MLINYKKIIKSQKLRLKILEFLSFLPDDFTIKYQYFIRTGRFVNLKNPTCKITDTVSIMHTKATMANNKGILSIIEIAAIAPPSAREPVSPINTFAG